MRFLASATVRLQGRAQALKDAAWICRSVASSADAWSSEDAAVSLYARAEARANASHVTLQARVAGVSFEGRQDVVRALRPTQRLLLHTEPQNPYDPRAVAVFTLSGQQVGYLPADVAPTVPFPECFGEVLSVGQAEEGAPWGAIIAVPTLLVPVTADAVVEDSLVAQAVADLKAFVSPEAWSALEGEVASAAMHACQVCGAPGPESPAASAATHEETGFLSSRRGPSTGDPRRPSALRSVRPRGHVIPAVDGVVRGRFGASPLWQFYPVLASTGQSPSDAPPAAREYRATLVDVRWACQCCLRSRAALSAAVREVAAGAASIEPTPELDFAADMNGWTEEEVGQYVWAKARWLSGANALWPHAARAPWRADLGWLGARGYEHAVPTDAVVS